MLCDRSGLWRARLEVEPAVCPPQNHPTHTLFLHHTSLTHVPAAVLLLHVVLSLLSYYYYYYESKDYSDTLH